MVKQADVMRRRLPCVTMWFTGLGLMVLGIVGSASLVIADAHLLFSS